MIPMKVKATFVVILCHVKNIYILINFSSLLYFIGPQIKVWIEIYCIKLCNDTKIDNIAYISGFSCKTRGTYPVLVMFLIKF